MTQFPHLPYRPIHLLRVHYGVLPNANVGCVPSFAVGVLTTNNNKSLQVQITTHNKLNLRNTEETLSCILIYTASFIRQTPWGSYKLKIKYQYSLASAVPLWLYPLKPPTLLSAPNTYTDVKMTLERCRKSNWKEPTLVKIVLSSVPQPLDFDISSPMQLTQLHQARTEVKEALAGHLSSCHMRVPGTVLPCRAGVVSNMLQQCRAATLSGHLQVSFLDRVLQKTRQVVF